MALAAGGILFNPVAEAASIGLVKSEEQVPAYPDIFSFRIDVDYYADTNTFTAIGRPSRVYYESHQYIVTGSSRTFNITAQIDEQGNPIDGGLTITGQIPGFTSGTLLTGRLIDFGFPDPPVSSGADIFEFIFGVIEGDLAPQYLPYNVGIILSLAGTDFTGSFETDFHGREIVPSVGIGVTDAFPAPSVPIPGAFYLILSGLALLIGVRKLSKRDS